MKKPGQRSGLPLGVPIRCRLAMTDARQRRRELKRSNWYSVRLAVWRRALVVGAVMGLRLGAQAMKARWILALRKFHG